jgi:hypothetical protein
MMACHPIMTSLLFASGPFLALIVATVLHLTLHQISTQVQRKYNNGLGIIT